MFKRKALTIALAAMMSMSAMTAMSAGASADWVKFSDGSYGYKDSSTSKQLTGWQTIGGGKYYFDKNGKALTGWKKISGNTYYFNAAKKGKACTSWTKIGGKQYYFGSDGVMRTGWIKLNGKTYYFGNDGVMRTGKLKINGTVYDFGTDGILKSTSGSSSSNSKLSSPMKGLSWGMDMDQVIEKAKLDKYLVMGSLIIVYDKDPFTYYLFDENFKLAGYGQISDYSASTVKSFRGYFTDDSWKYEAVYNENGSKVYIYSKDGSIGAVVYDKDACMTMILSEALSDGVMDGSITDLVNIDM